MPELGAHSIVILVWGVSMNGGGSPLYVVVIRSVIANSSGTHRVNCQQLAVNTRRAHRVDHHMTEDDYRSQAHDRLLIRNLFWDEMDTIGIHREELSDPVIAVSVQSDRFAVTGCGALKSSKHTSREPRGRTRDRSRSGPCRRFFRSSISRQTPPLMSWCRSLCCNGHET